MVLKVSWLTLIVLFSLILHITEKKIIFEQFIRRKMQCYPRLGGIKTHLQIVLTLYNCVIFRHLMVFCIR